MFDEKAKIEKQSRTSEKISNYKFSLVSPRTQPMFENSQSQVSRQSISKKSFSLSGQSAQKKKQKKKKSVKSVLDSIQKEQQDMLDPNKEHF